MAADTVIAAFFPRDDWPDALLVANRLEGAERVSRDFEFKIEALSDRPDIKLKEVMGKMVTLELRRKDDSVRYFNGFVFSFRYVKNDGGFSCYEMLLRPWLAFLRYRDDNRIFHHLNLREQTQKVFERYLERDWQIRCPGEDPVMADAFQYGESDYNYLHRRWEYQGWHYWYEHRKDGHTLMLSDDSTLANPIDGSGEIFWKGEHPEQVGMDRFSAIREIASTNYAATNFDFQNSTYPFPALGAGQNLQGDIPALEVHEYVGSYGYRNPGDGDEVARRRR